MYHTAFLHPDPSITELHVSKLDHPEFKMLREMLKHNRYFDTISTPYSTDFALVSKLLEVLQSLSAHEVAPLHKLNLNKGLLDTCAQLLHDFLGNPYSPSLLPCCPLLIYFFFFLSSFHVFVLTDKPDCFITKLTMYSIYGNYNIYSIISYY